MVTAKSRGKLNAPEGYVWQDEDVLFEKRQSWYDGWIAGFITAFFVCGLLALLVVAVIH